MFLTAQAFFLVKKKKKEVGHQISPRSTPFPTKVPQLPSCPLWNPVLPFHQAGEIYLHEFFPHVSRSSYPPDLPLHCASPVLFSPSPFQNLLLPPFTAVSTTQHYLSGLGSSRLLLRANIHRCFLCLLPKFVQKLSELPVTFKIQNPLMQKRATAI